MKTLLRNLAVAVCVSAGSVAIAETALVENLPEKMAAATGVVKGIGEKQLIIDHGPIQGSTMGAMTMGFNFLKNVDVSNLAEGDEIAFLMKVGRDGSFRIAAICKPAQDGDDCLQSLL